MMSELVQINLVVYIAFEANFLKGRVHFALMKCESGFLRLSHVWVALFIYLFFLNWQTPGETFQTVAKVMPATTPSILPVKSLVA